MEIKNGYHLMCIFFCFVLAAAAASVLAEQINKRITENDMIKATVLRNHPQ